MANKDSRAVNVAELVGQRAADLQGLEQQCLKQAQQHSSETSQTINKDHQHNLWRWNAPEPNHRRRRTTSYRRFKSKPRTRKKSKTEVTVDEKQQVKLSRKARRKSKEWFRADEHSYKYLYSHLYLAKRMEMKNEVFGTKLNSQFNEMLLPVRNRQKGNRFLNRVFHGVFPELCLVFDVSYFRLVQVEFNNASMEHNQKHLADFLKRISPRDYDLRKVLASIHSSMAENNSLSVFLEVSNLGPVQLIIGLRKILFFVHGLITTSFVSLFDQNSIGKCEIRKFDQVFNLVGKTASVMEVVSKLKNKLNQTHEYKDLFKKEIIQIPSSDNGFGWTYTDLGLTASMTLWLPKVEGQLWVEILCKSGGVMGGIEFENAYHTTLGNRYFPVDYPETPIGKEYWRWRCESEVKSLHMKPLASLGFKLSQVEDVRDLFAPAWQKLSLPLMGTTHDLCWEISYSSSDAELGENINKNRLCLWCVHLSLESLPGQRQLMFSPPVQIIRENKIVGFVTSINGTQHENTSKPLFGIGFVSSLIVDQSKKVYIRDVRSLAGEGNSCQDVQVKMIYIGI